MKDAHKNEKKKNNNNNRSEPCIVHPWNIQRSGCVSIVGHPQTNHRFENFEIKKQDLNFDGLSI